MTPENEEKLIVRARSGDQEAYTRLVERYGSMVYGLAYHRLSHFEDARDVAQNVFVSAFLNLKQLQDTGKFAPWLRRITANACTAFRRNAVRTEPLDQLGLAPDQVEPLLARLSVAQALDCLSEDTRLTLTLYYFQSYSTHEIALFLGVPSTTIKSRLRDGRARLKKEMLTMIEETVRQEPLGADFPGRVRALTKAAISGDFAEAQSLLARDSSLVSGHGEVPEEHMRRANAHDGWTPLHLAAHYGHLSLVKLLVEHGADLEAVSQNVIGNTPISAAAWGDQKEIVAYLLDQGAVVDAPNKWGSTALHRAVQADRKPLVELLLARGADPSRSDGEGRTALEMAQAESHAEIVAVLTAHSPSLGVK